MSPDTAQPSPLPSAPTRKKPGELGLDFSAAVLRLPYPAATRLVMAEIISLYAANAGLCDASDAHFAARLTLNKDTVSVAIQRLEKDGLLLKTVTRFPTGFYRLLVPQSAAVIAKAVTNPYPEFPTRLPRNSPYPENPGTPTRKFRPALPGNSGSKPTLKPTPNLSVTPHPASAPAAAPAEGAGAEKKIEGDEISTLPAERPTASASHTGGAARVGTRKAAKAKAAGPALLLLRDSLLAEFPAFADAWEAAAEAHPETYADYGDAHLKHYHAALLDWSDGNNKKKYDWLATIRNSIRNDHAAGKLRTYGVPTASPGDAGPSSWSLPGEGVAPAGSPAQRRWPHRNGDKPTTEAGQFARALAQRRGLAA